MNGTNMYRQPLSTGKQRDGVTLLFVLSMIVLFLLMGTTFVVVSNDYFRSAQRRSFVASNVFDGEEFLDSAFYQLFRDVPLGDNTSPIRFHSILADQYGYGFKSTVEAMPVPGGQFVAVNIGANFANPTAAQRAAGQTYQISSIRTPGQPVTLRSSPTYFDNALNGRVFSITSGTLAGTSRRIVSHSIVEGTATNGSQDMLAVTLLRGNVNWAGVENGNSVVINGRDFSGVGFGDVTSLEFEDFDLTDASPGSLGPAGPLGSRLPQNHPFAVNQLGVPFAALTNIANIGYVNGTTDGTGALTAGTGFISINGSPNEAYDAPDFQNMFLGARYPNGVGPDLIIPSFHRDTFYSYVTRELGLPLPPTQIRRFNFRPFLIDAPANDNNVADGSTANRGFPMGYLNTTNGALIPDSLDVDSDGDGILDSVWIDIGLPTQTTSTGDTFRPLVAYRVIDMDGKLNVNAHGSNVDLALGAGTRRGSGYGVAEISLSGVSSNYAGLIADRANSNTTGTDERFTEDQKLFGYVYGGNTDILSLDTTISGGLFSTGSNVLGRHTVQSDTASPNELPGFGAAVGTTLTTVQLANPYTKDFSIGGGTGDDLYTPSELEVLLRPFDSDSGLIASRLRNVIAAANFRDVTTDSYNISIPTAAVSLPERLNNILQANGATSATIPTLATLMNGLLPRDILLGGKLDLNRPLGNGLDDEETTPDGVVDNNPEGMPQMSDQRGSPILDLDNGDDDEANDSRAKYLLAKDIYVTMLLACGEYAPAGFTVTTPTETFGPTAPSETVKIYPEPTTSPFRRALTANDYEYRKLVAQYAVNLVDFRDPDSIMTGFEFDLEPFDSAGWEVDGNLASTDTDSHVVWGAERPDLLLTETFASHDRQTRDGTIGGETSDPPPMNDDDWDAINAPFTSAIFEIYNPWLSGSLGLANGTYGQPNELGDGTGINLGQLNGGSPVWRIGLKRDQDELNSSIVRAIYFANPGATPPADFTGDSFFPTTSGGLISPGGFVSVAPSTNPTIDGVAVTTAGTVVAVDMPRELSISDRNGGYVNSDNSFVRPGMPFATPLDATPDNFPGHNPDDLAMISTNGIVDNFRHAYLQRLADPTAAFNVDTNPYLTIDTMSVDLLAGNTLDGRFFGSNATPAETYEVGGMGVAVVDLTFELRSTQRGETFASAANARNNLFTAERGEPESDATEAVPATASNTTFGTINTNYAGATAAPYGSLTWNNRPFASAAEALNVPYLSGGLLTYFFNTQPALPAGTMLDPIYEAYRTEIVPFFSSNGITTSIHNHLLRFDLPLGLTGGTAINANRLARLFDFVEVPSRFLGTETFLEPIGGAYPAGFNPPFNFVPTFREPGKVNINTIRSAPAWAALEGGFGPVTTIAALQAERNVSSAAVPTDLAGYFTSSEGRMFVPDVSDPSFEPAKGSAGTIFRMNTAGSAGLFDTTTTGIQDSAGTAYFKNELRQRLSGMVTTKSSVFSIWITIGYFEVDEFGRLGAEIGSDEGDVKRNRAFYMVDRSIPVAFEPGRNHNVDDAVLLRTIIE